MADAAGTGSKKVAPPYIAFQTVDTMSGNFKEHGLPDRIDRSVLTNFSGAVGAQLITALRFLNLIDGAGVPTPLMRELVDAHGGNAWQATLAKVLKQAYAPIFQLNLQTCTPAQFLERFRATYDGADDVVRKGITFFLNALRAAEIPVSAFILKARKPRTAAAKKRPARTGAKNERHGRNDGDGEDDENDPPPPSPTDPAQLLLQMLDTDAMEDEEQEAVWTLLKYLKKK